MNARRVEVTLSQVLWDRFELARGREPRAAFVRRAVESAIEFEERLPEPPSGVLESALERHEPQAREARFDQPVGSGSASAASSPASSRASDREAAMDDLGGPVVSPGVRGPQPQSVEVYAGDVGTAPGCPECAAHMTHDGVRWVCPDCGFVGAR